jgi:hypothetical protein
METKQPGANDGVRYLGPDRRRGEERRQGHDRRDMIRFEMKEDRRSGKDRRQQDGWGKPLSRY